ncbi:MAG: glycosyltransferase family 39 protein [Isosphaeraceae bacterium]|nr:glycosyltransferase family 39 protein [Isosphaeraceae bacterium]
MQIDDPDRNASSHCFLELVIAAVVGSVTLVVLLATARDFGMAWDEGHTIRRELVLDRWLDLVLNPPADQPRRDLFSKRELEIYWRFSREEPDGHPPFYAILGVAGWRLTRGSLDRLSSFRFGPMALFGVTAGALYFHLSMRRGRLAGLVASAALALMPRMFAHAHYAHYDIPMTCFWLLAQVAFVNALRRPFWCVPFGVFLGLSAGSKFTGWFAPLAPVLWVVLVEALPRARQKPAPPPEALSPRPFLPAGARALLVGLPIMALTLYAIQPPWWDDPVHGVQRFLQSNLSRSRTVPIPTLYLGRIYAFSLPWHNTLVLTAVTTPILIAVAALAGGTAAVARARREPSDLIWPISWAVLIVVRALPNAPGHDGVRLFLPSVASLAPLAGMGVAWLADLLKPRGRAWMAWGFAALAIGECLAGIAQTYPYTDSYYNVAVGGLRGAERAGFELTYYWETIGPEFLQWVRAEARKGPLELRFPSDLIVTRYLQAWGVLPANVKVMSPRQMVVRPCYVLQRRRGVYYPLDWWLEAHGQPIFRIRRQGVDLMRVYSFEDAYRAHEATKLVPVPSYLPE